MGHLISAGTGLTRYKNLAVDDPENEDDAIIEAVEQLRAMAAAAEAAGEGDSEMAAE